MKQRVLSILGCMLIATRLLAEGTNTISVTFKDFPAGQQYAVDEQHDLGNGLVIYTTKCHFTTELRIYSSNTNNGVVISDPLPGVIVSISFNMGNEKDVLNVYGSTDKENWTLIKGIETTSTSYKNYSLNFPAAKGYTCFKLDVKGDKQIRIASMSITYTKDDSENGSEGNDGNTEGEGDDENKEEENIVVSVPIFNPVSTSFSTEFLDVTIESAEGCEVYYTKDGTTPSYTNAEEYVGTKGNVATIYATDSKVKLQAIAVNPNTGKSSNVSSATYTYVSTANDGTKSRPYTVAEVAAMSNIKNGKWVKGTIYGTMVGSRIEEITTSDFSSQNMVIGDETIHIPVQLPKGDIRDNINLNTHPYLRGKNILLKGNLESYCGAQGIKEPTEYIITYDVAINSYGYATLFLDIPVSVPSNSTAYYCSTEEDYVCLHPVGNIIPAHVGVIIESVPNTMCSLTYVTEVDDNEESILDNNQLIGFIDDTDVADSDYAYYALNARDGKVGFYNPQTTTETGFIAKANKAYLRVPAEQKVAMFLFHRGEDETIIVSTVNNYEHATYDLQGRVVTSPTSGIYIRGGKKIVIK